MNRMARCAAPGDDTGMTQSHLPRLAVVGHDGRHGGDIALDAALGLREHFGTTVIVVHSLDLPTVRDIAGRPDEIELMRTGACDRVEGVLSERLDTKLGAGADGVELAVFPGSPVAAIAEVARDRRADVLVLGPHRKDGPLDFGRTTRARLAPIAVRVASSRRRASPRASCRLPTLAHDSTRMSPSAATIIGSTSRSFRPGMSATAVPKTATVPDLRLPAAVNRSCRI